ncbi:MAG: glycosyltransferase, partial [Deltaproteobacteria bacterium]|nr:glycosyltransferase [Deltaproteobacteria bacterium]
VAGLLGSRPVVQLTITDPAWIEKNPLCRWALRKAQAIGFRGHTTLNQFSKTHGSNKILFVPQNVWEPPRPVAAVPKSIDILYVGFLAGYKNIGAWLKTVAEVKRHRGKVRAVMVGDKPNCHIRRLTERLGIDSDVEFTGPLYGEPLDRHYAQARVFLLTSRWEGLPMVLVEAMAAGVPVVSTKVGDIPDLVKHGDNGFLVNTGDVRSATAAVHRLLQDRSLRLSMSEKARAAAAELLSKSTCERVAQQWRGVFFSLGLAHT